MAADLEMWSNHVESQIIDQYIFMLVILLHYYRGHGFESDDLLAAAAPGQNL